jgi:hypothetical protein
VTMYRVIPKPGTKSPYEAPRDFLLYDVRASTSRQLLDLQEMEATDRGDTTRYLAIVVEDPVSGPWAVVVPNCDTMDVLRGVEIEAVADEFPVHHTS